MSENQNNPAALFCFNHPQRETLLRCNRCERPICIDCAVKTPTGYRCKECVRGQQKIFETAQTQDYLLAVVISAAFAFAGSVVASFLGFFTILVAPGVGMLGAEVIRRAVHKRRSKLLFQLAAGAAILGCLPLLGLQLWGMNIMGIIWQGLYVSLTVSSLYFRLSGIQIK
jgi:hypothetical protein